jgi:hypothetical protein
LLKAYCKKYCEIKRAEFESGFPECRELTEDDPNFMEGYSFQVDASHETSPRSSSN